MPSTPSEEVTIPVSDPRNASKSGWASEKSRSVAVTLILAALTASARRNRAAIPMAARRVNDLGAEAESF